MGLEVKVVVNDYGRFFGCGFEGALERVQTLPPDDTAVRLVLSGGAGSFFDPPDVEVFVDGGFPEGPTWLEFRLSAGPTVMGCDNYASHLTADPRKNSIDMTGIHSKSILLVLLFGIARLAASYTFPFRFTSIHFLESRGNTSGFTQATRCRSHAAVQRSSPGPLPGHCCQRRSADLCRCRIGRS
ncbi:MAG: hypothetical protein ACJ75S_07565 [Solirubrobacterales bacterium]